MCCKVVFKPFRVLLFCHKLSLNFLTFFYLDTYNKKMEKPENCETNILSLDEGVKETKVKNCIYMLPSKLTYLFLWGLLYSYGPFLYVFFISVGLTASQAGLITGLRYLVSFIAGPVWAALADYTGRHRLIYCLLCIGTIISVFPMPWIAEWANPKEHGITNQHQILNLTNSTLNLLNGKQNSLSANDKLFKVMLSLGLISAAFALRALTRKNIHEEYSIFLLFFEYSSRFYT